MSDVEIGAKLKFETGDAGDAIGKIKGSAEGLKSTFAEIGATVKDVAVGAIGQALGIQMSGMLDTIKDIGRGAIDEAMGLQREYKELTSTLQVLDQTGASWEQLSKNAEGYHTQLMDIAHGAHALEATAVSVFSDVAYRTGKSADEAKRLTDQILQAGRAVPGGAEKLAEGFNNLENGMIKAKNPLVQLIKASGQMSGSGKEIAKSLTEAFAKDPSKVFQIAETAIAKMADKMKSVPPTMDEMITDLKEIRANIYEAAGVPLLKAITPQLEKLKKYFEENGEEVEQWATRAGEWVGDAVVEAAQLFKDGFEFIQQHADDIRDALKEGWGVAKEVAQFIIANKETIALIAGGAMARKGVVGAVGMGMDAFGAAKGAGSAIAGGMGLGASAASSAVALGVFAAAIVAVGVAAWQGQKLYNELEDMEDTRKKEKLKIAELVKAGKVDTLQNAAYTEENIQQGKMTGVAGSDEQSEEDFEKMAMLEAAIKEAKINRARLDEAMGSEAAAMAEAIDAAANETATAMENATATHSAAAMAQANEIAGSSIIAIINAYNAAAASGNTAAMQYAMETIGASTVLQDALFESGLTVTTGIDGMADMLIDASSDFANRLGSLEGMKQFGSKAGKGSGSPKMSLSGGGPVTINIKQDFRDQDPDRVMLVFRKDLQREAANRLQSKIGIPGGM